jgi:hypothetical protein
MSILKKTTLAASLFAVTAALGGCYAGPAYGPRYAYRPAYGYGPVYRPAPYGYAPYGGVNVTVGGGYHRHW